jgi:hypothetical protein
MSTQQSETLSRNDWRHPDNLQQWLRERYGDGQVTTPGQVAADNFTDLFEAYRRGGQKTFRAKFDQIFPPEQHP